MPLNVEELTEMEKEELLRWFLHWLPQDRRGQLMRRYPQHYNKMLGRELMEVIVRPEDCDDCQEPITGDTFAGMDYTLCKSCYDKREGV